MIHPTHLRNLIIIPTLEYLDMNSPSAVRLMLGTAAQESACGKYLMQIGPNEEPRGPALGIYQQEPATHEDIWDNYLEHKTTIRDKIFRIIVYRIATPEFLLQDNLIFNLYYATAMARLQYWRRSEPLPDEHDILGMADYWKTYYNTELGKGTRQEFVDNYKRYIQPWEESWATN